MKDAYKIFRELEERNKRAYPYKFYDKDELIDEILKDKDEIERLNNIIEKIRDYVYKPIDKEWDDILCIIEDGRKDSDKE